jgi:large subunit ribosomal protein L28
MSRVCALTGKSYQRGHQISHSNRKKIKRFQVNLKPVTLVSDALKQKFRLRIAVSTLRSIDHNGGLDAFLLTANNADLSDEAVVLKRKIRKSVEAAAA